jgi:hypothetical protein
VLLSCNAHLHREMIHRYTVGEMAYGSLRNGRRVGSFVGLLLGVDVVALQYPVLQGPIAPTIGGCLAGALMSWRAGAIACVSASLLGAAMGNVAVVVFLVMSVVFTFSKGLSYGIARKAVDIDKLFDDDE